VLAPHLCAAAAEVPLTEADQDRFGPASTPLLRDLVARGFLRRRPTGWYWNYNRPESPTDLTDLRGGGGAPVQVIEAATGRVLGTVDAARADAPCTPARCTCTRAEPSAWTPTRTTSPP